MSYVSVRILNHICLCKYGYVDVSMGHVHMDFESFHALLKLLNK